MRYALNNNTTKGISYFVKKFANKIPVKNDYVDGEITVTKYRKYNFYEEVDIIFEGKIKGKVSFSSEWYGSEIINGTKKFGWTASKIKVNRLIRRHVFETVKDRLRFFNVTLTRYNYIKKVKWV
jgi:hypothetical protein